MECGRCLILSAELESSERRYTEDAPSPLERYGLFGPRSKSARPMQNPNKPVLNISGKESSNLNSTNANTTPCKRRTLGRAWISQSRRRCEHSPQMT